jgi:GT2 family glycosyltransferase
MANLHIGIVVHGCPAISVPCVNNLNRLQLHYGRTVRYHLLDNGTPEADRGAVRACLTQWHLRQDKDTNVMFLDENTGCAAGWNRIIKAAISDPECKYILLMGHDVACHPDAPENLIARFEKGDVDLVTGVPFEADGELTIGDWEHPGPDFSCILIPRRVIEAVGYFDEKFWPAYFEDNDYHHRCKLAGCGMGIRTSTAPFRHSRSATVSTYPGLHQHFGANRAYFISKWGLPPDELGAALPWKGHDVKEPA